MVRGHATHMISFPLVRRHDVLVAPQGSPLTFLPGLCGLWHPLERSGPLTRGPQRATRSSGLQPFCPVSIIGVKVLASPAQALESYCMKFYTSLE